ncbi:MAG TPA: PH domain-containing protein [Pseudoxanthomonas sp.]|jgi:hypothetical protein|nr:PH domain-containing protein [Pseudoxanthomonas sp.]
MQKEFPLAPLSNLAWLGLWLPMLLAAGVVIGVAVMPHQATPAHGLMVALPLLLVIAAGLTWAARRRRIVLANRELQITATLYRKQVAVEAIDLDKARVLSLDEHTELRPMVKTNGFNLPGLSAGHYRMRNLAKAFCLVTDRSKVLVLPLHDGLTVLLSPEKPRELLDQLHELAGHRPAR